VVSSLPLWRCTAECGEIEYGELPVAYYPLPQRLSTQSCGDDAPDESPFRRARALRLDALRPTSVHEVTFALRRQVISDILALRNAAIHLWYEKGARPTNRSTDATPA